MSYDEKERHIPSLNQLFQRVITTYDPRIACAPYTAEDYVADGFGIEISDYMDSVLQRFPTDVRHLMTVDLIRNVDIGSGLPFSSVAVNKNCRDVLDACELFAKGQGILSAEEISDLADTIDSGKGKLVDGVYKCATIAKSHLLPWPVLTSLFMLFPDSEHRAIYTSFKKIIESYGGGL